MQHNHRIAAVTSKFAAKPSKIASLVALAMLSLPAAAGPGKVCLDLSTPAAGQCADGSAPIGTYYANSPTLRKFVDTLPGLTAAGANRFGNSAKTGAGEYIPLAAADTTTYPGSNYFVIAVVEHQQWMHSDLQKPTTLRSYVQIYPQGQSKQPAGSTRLTYPNGKTIFWKDSSGKDTTEPVYGVDKPHYLGPIILSMSGTPVRVKMVNFLPTGSATLDPVTKLVTARNGDMFLPVDESLAGAGTAPDPLNPNSRYTQNRVAFHLHGGDSPWVSDGTPHQWIAAAGDPTLLKKGDRLVNIPDMPFPGDGAQTLFWPNDQSARLMWYHDHTFGLTRQNAYAGAAAGYVILDAAELALLGGGTVNGVTINKALPGGLLDQVVLVIQDKSFVPNDIAVQDSKWNTTAWGKPGDLWFPHVYEPNQLWSKTLADGSTATNPAGRWDYATDVLGNFLPPNAPSRIDPDYGSVAFPDGSYADGTPGKGPSATPESYMDTPLVNGVAYPVLNVEPKAYRVRFLNGANDRYWNLSLWVADANAVSADGRHNTEVAMLTSGTAEYNTANGSAKVLVSASRPGGIPDPSTAGPNIIQFATEAGLLPSPVVHTPKPVSGYSEIDGTFVLSRGADFYLGGAERADTVIDFSQYAGKTLILYNDSSAPVPGGDVRYDYYTGNPDLRSIGGAPSTLAGYGPNTRTVMQIVVAPTLVSGAQPTPADAYDPSGTGGMLGSELPKAFAASASPHIAPEVTASNLPQVDFAANTIALSDGTHSLSVKTIEGFTDPNFGRLIAQIGMELPDANGSLITTPLAYIDQPTDIINAGETQYWLIKNNDGDNHPMHFHLFNVQVLARVDQATKQVIAPQPDETGWKETVKNWPGEDVIVALHPKTPQLPFGLPNSVRLLDPTLPAGSVTSPSLRPGPDTQFAFLQMDLSTGQNKAVANTSADFGWEYVWHCHILGHEENDLMRPLVFKPVITAPAAPAQVSVSATGALAWTDPTPAGGADQAGTPTKGNAANEIGFAVQRVALKSGKPLALNADGTPQFATLPAASGTRTIDARVNTLANATAFQDAPAANTDYLYRVVSVNEAGVGISDTVTLSQPAAAPSGLTAVQSAAVAGSNLAVNLRWIDNASNETGYTIKRDGVVIASTAADASSYTDVLTAPLTTKSYVYTVAAAKTGFADSAASSAVFKPAVKLLPASNLSASYTAATKVVNLTWQDQSFGETGYVVKRATGTVNAKTGAVTWSALAARPTASTVLAANTFGLADTAVAPDSLLQYQVTAMNGSAAGPVASVVTASSSSLAAPTQVQASGTATTSSVTFAWEDSATPITTGYEVQRCDGSIAVCGAPAALWTAAAGTLTQGTGTSKFAATGLSSKAAYAFRVRAVNTAVPMTTTGEAGLVSAWTAAYAAATR